MIEKILVPLIFILSSHTFIIKAVNDLKQQSVSQSNTKLESEAVQKLHFLP